MIRRSPLWRGLVYGLLGLWSVICVFPIYVLAITSIRPGDDSVAGPRYLPFVDFRPSLEAWRFILFDAHDNLVSSLVNSAVVALAASALALTSGSLAAYALTRFAFRFPRQQPGSANRSIMTGLIATRILPPATLALPLFLMAQASGTFDTPLALILTYAAINLPVALWLLQPVLGTRASEQEEAARLDGASHALIFFTIVAPMAAGGFAATGFLVFALCWNEYLFAAYLTIDHAVTLPVWLVGQLSMKEAQATAEATELAHFSAVAILMILPLLIFAGLAQRVLTRRSMWRL